MKLLITGASGYVGGRIFYDLNSDFEVVGTYFSNKISDNLIQLDVTDHKQVDKLIGDVKPQIIIHIANNPSSKWCSEHPKEAILLNQTSSDYLLDTVNKLGIKIIYMSTMGAIVPKDLYQKTKAFSEKVFEKTVAGYLNLRPSVGIGCSPDKKEKNFFNNIVECVESKTGSEFDISLKLQPTHLSHISAVIKNCIEKNIWNKTIPISVQESKSQYEIATDILKEFGIKTSPVDMHIPPFNSVNNVDEELMKLDLPIFAYDRVIQMSIDDIKNLKKFVILK